MEKLIGDLDDNCETKNLKRRRDTYRETSVKTQL